MSLINGTYFFGDINLPGGQYSNLSDFITKFEDEYLRITLGYQLAALTAAYDGTPGVITDLVEGVEFLLNGETVKWNGLANTELVSPISYYVYYRYIEDLNTQTNNVGIVKPEQENSRTATAYQKMVSAWRKMFSLTCGNPGGYHVSLWTYLTAHKEDYPAWIDVIKLDNINSFGI